MTNGLALTPDKELVQELSNEVPKLFGHTACVWKINLLVYRKNDIEKKVHSLN